MRVANTRHPMSPPLRSRGSGAPQDHSKSAADLPGGYSYRRGPPSPTPRSAGFGTSPVLAPRARTPSSPNQIAGRPARGTVSGFGQQFGQAPPAAREAGARLSDSGTAGGVNRPGSRDCAAPANTTLPYGRALSREGGGTGLPQSSLLPGRAGSRDSSARQPSIHDRNRAVHSRSPARLLPGGQASSGQPGAAGQNGTASSQAKPDRQRDVVAWADANRVGGLQRYNGRDSGGQTFVREGGEGNGAAPAPAPAAAPVPTAPSTAAAQPNLRTSLLHHIQTMQQEIVRLQAERQRATGHNVSAAPPTTKTQKAPVPNRSPAHSPLRQKLPLRPPAVGVGSQSTPTSTGRSPRNLSAVDTVSARTAGSGGPEIVASISPRARPKPFAPRVTAAIRIQRAWRLRQWRLGFVRYSERRVGWLGSLEWLQAHNLIYGTELADPSDTEWWALQRSRAYSDREVDPWGNHHMREHLRRIWGQYDDEVVEQPQETRRAGSQPAAQAAQRAQRAVPARPQARAASLNHSGQGARLSTGSSDAGQQGRVSSQGPIPHRMPGPLAASQDAVNRSTSQGPFPGRVPVPNASPARPSARPRLETKAPVTLQPARPQGRVVSQSPQRTNPGALGGFARDRPSSQPPTQGAAAAARPASVGGWQPQRQDARPPQLRGPAAPPPRAGPQQAWGYMGPGAGILRR
mmetsp:Transcript_112987/g.258786  ORF Transcript_112987/g.258786 Transcript_112987/m.258786 type:complete len:688 (+) Transcript_112987:113-2176(+)